VLEESEKKIGLDVKFTDVYRRRASDHRRRFDEPQAQPQQQYHVPVVNATASYRSDAGSRPDRSTARNHRGQLPAHRRYQRAASVTTPAEHDYQAYVSPIAYANPNPNPYQHAYQAMDYVSYMQFAYMGYMPSSPYAATINATTFDVLNQTPPNGGRTRREHAER
jgi:hypothetical protein